MVSRIVTVAALVGAVTAVWADSITVNGKTYRDVLIRTTANLYYVTLPDEGRVLTLSRHEVDPASVSIVDDPIYRDRLKAIYEENRAAPKPRSYQSIDEADVVADARAMVDAANDSDYQIRPIDEFAQPSDGGGSGSADGLGVTAAELQTAVQSAGVTMAQQGMQAGHPRFSGRSSSGHLEVDAYGPEENLKHLNLVVTASDLGQLQSSLMAVAPMLEKIAPWAPEWFMQNQAALMASNSVETTQGNIRLRMQAGQSGANISLTITFDAVG